MYIRKAYIEVFEKKDDEIPILLIEGLRITGEVKYAYDSADVVARLVVYNLSLENRKTLLIKDKSERDERMASHYVKLYVGHQDEDFVGGEKPLILQGPLVNSFSFSKRPEVHTVMYVVPSGHHAALNEITPFEATPNMTLGQALKEIGRRGGYEVTDVSRLPDHIVNTSVRGSVFGLEKSLQREMLKLGQTYHFMTRYSANKMVVKLKQNIPTSLAVSEEVAKETDGPPPLVIATGVVRAPFLDSYKITVDMVRDNPNVGQASLTLSVTLAPELEHVEVIDLSEVRDLIIYDGIGDALYRDGGVREYLSSDFYRVSSILHVFDTHGQAWNTFIEAHIFTDGMRVGTK